MWLITYFIFLQLKSLKLSKYRNTRNVIYQQGREIVTSIIRGRENETLTHGGREKVIWAGGRRKVNGAGVGEQRTKDGGPRKSNTHVFV